MRYFTALYVYTYLRCVYYLGIGCRVHAITDIRYKNKLLQQTLTLAPGLPGRSKDYVCSVYWVVNLHTYIHTLSLSECILAKILFTSCSSWIM